MYFVLSNSKVLIIYFSNTITIIDIYFLDIDLVLEDVYVLTKNNRLINIRNYKKIITIPSGVLLL